MCCHVRQELIGWACTGPLGKYSNYFWLVEEGVCSKTGCRVSYGLGHYMQNSVVIHFISSFSSKFFLVLTKKDGLRRRWIQEVTEPRLWSTYSSNGPPPPPRSGLLFKHACALWGMATQLLQLIHVSEPPLTMGPEWLSGSNHQTHRAWRVTSHDKAEDIATKDFKLGNVLEPRNEHQRFLMYCGHRTNI